MPKQATLPEDYVFDPGAYDRVRLRDIKEGRPFWDPDTLTWGSIRYKFKDGETFSVRLHRYQGGGLPEQDNAVIGGNWLVVRGDMPADVKLYAQQKLDAAREELEENLSKRAADMFNNGEDISAIAEALEVSPKDAQHLIRRGTSEATKTPKAKARRGTEPKPTTKRVTTASGPQHGKDDPEEVDAYCWELRKRGESFAAIADKVGYKSKASARSAVMRGRAAAGEEED